LAHRQGRLTRARLEALVATFMDEDGTYPSALEIIVALDWSLEAACGLI